MSRPETCAVCHQKAFGYNYEVASCNACKMFFRRSQLEDAEEPCRHQGICFDGDDVAVRRPRCRPCRLKKCIALGMRHRPSSESTDDGGTTQDPAPTTSLVLVTQDHVDSACLQKLYCLRQTWSRLYSVINICEDASFRDLVLDGSKLGVYSRPQAIDWEDTKNKLKPWATLGVLLTVEVCKTMDVYNELLLSDRALLLKNVAFKSYHLTIAFDSYQNKKGRIFSPVGGEVFPSMMFSIMPCYEVIMELLVTCVEPLIRLQLSEQEYMLLNMILICNPGIRGMSPGGQDTLSRHQKYYSRILLKHCLLQDPRHGPSRFSALLTINQCLERQVAITQRLAAMLRKHWNPNYCLPRILREACRMEDIYV